MIENDLSTISLAESIGRSVEKNDRTDLAEEFVTREQVDANYQRTTAEQKAKTNVWLKAQKVRPDGLRRTSANTTRE